MRALAALRAMDWEKRRKIARWTAFGVDALQIALLPILFPGTPWNNFLDLLTGVLMVALLGWHVAFLPTIVTELIPFVDLFPTWTVAVMYVTRKAASRRRSSTRIEE